MASSRSMAQLRHQTWASRDAAEKDLRQAGLPANGSDYELAETAAGSGVWWLADRADNPSQEEVREPPLRGKAKPAMTRIKTAPKPGRETLPKQKRKAEEPEPKAEAKAKTRTKAKSEPGEKGKSAQAVDLLMREGGATKAEIVAITEWSFGERYIRRLARSSKTEMVVLGANHWRLIKQED